MTSAFYVPDWVLLGVPNSDGSVAVWGSVEMTQAELRAERDIQSYADGIILRHMPGSVRYFLNAQMQTMAVAFGATYAEAIALLFAGWDADKQRRPAAHALAVPRLAIDAAT